VYKILTARDNLSFDKKNKLNHALLRKSTQMTFVLFRYQIIMPTAYASVSAYYAIE
jgi:hypothetical protein